MKQKSKNKPVWKFTNQREITKQEFVRYFEKKVKSSIRKYNMPIHPLKSNDLKAKIIRAVTFSLKERKGRISIENLDDISPKILHTMLYGRQENLKNLLPKNQPLYFLSDKEIILYAKIKKIKGEIKRSKNLKNINEFLEKLEQKNPDIRQNIVRAVIKSNLLSS